MRWSEKKHHLSKMVETMLTLACMAAKRITDLKRSAKATQEFLRTVTSVTLKKKKKKSTWYYHLMEILK